MKGVAIAVAILAVVGGSLLLLRKSFDSPAGNVQPPVEGVSLTTTTSVESATGGSATGGSTTREFVAPAPDQSLAANFAKIMGIESHEANILDPLARAIKLLPTDRAAGERAVSDLVDALNKGSSHGDLLKLRLKAARADADEAYPANWEYGTDEDRQKIFFELVARYNSDKKANLPEAYKVSRAAFLFMAEQDFGYERGLLMNFLEQNPGPIAGEMGFDEKQTADFVALCKEYVAQDLIFAKSYAGILDAKAVLMTRERPDTIAALLDKVERARAAATAYDQQFHVAQLIRGVLKQLDVSGRMEGASALRDAVHEWGKNTADGTVKRWLDEAARTGQQFELR